MTDLTRSDDRLDAPPESRRRDAESGADGSVPTETGGPTERNWAPTWTSTALALVVTVATAGIVGTRVGPLASIVVAGADAALFAGSLWLLGRERWRAVARATVAALSLFVGGAFVAGVGYAALSSVSALFPVAETAQIPPAGLRLASTTLAVVGAGLAFVGGAATVGNVLREDTVRAYAALTAKAVTVPTVVGTALILDALRRNLGDAAADGPAAQVAGTVDVIGNALLSPAPGRTHLLAFCLVLGVTAAALSRAVGALPLSELATGEAADDVERAEETARAGLQRLAVAAGLALPIAGLEVLLGQERLAGLLPDFVYAVLAAVTASSGLRTVLAVLAALAVATVAAVAALRWLAQTPTAEVLVRLAPVAGGAVVVAVALASRGVVLDATVPFVADRLPPAFAELFTTHVDAVVEFYGSATVAVSLSAALVGSTALLTFLLSLVIALDLLPADLAAPALASAGLFAAAAFAGASGAGAPVVIGGVVAALLVWDLGAYGVVLGREVGRAAPSRGPELVHAGATLAVGALGAVGAAGLARAVDGAPLTDVAALPVAVASVVVALLALLAALR